MGESLNMFVTLYVLISIVLNISVVIGILNCEIQESDYMFFTPNYLRECSEMNWFGCYLVSVVLFAIFLPYATIATAIWFLYFITHVGRKD